MAPSPSQKPKKQKPTPTTVADFTILILTLPPLPSLPAQHQHAKHFLYAKPHAPSVPTPTAEKSLFVANVPVDATEANLRALFADHLGGSRVASVQFDSAVPEATAHKRWKSAVGVGGKRKREEGEEDVAEGVVEDEDSALPRVWNGEVRRSGCGAVVEFVDKRSARGALKEMQRIGKEGRGVPWMAGMGLGVDRYTSHTTLSHPSPHSLQTSINAYLTQFSTLERSRAKSRKQARTLPDEDGFVTVARGGRAGPARIEDAQKKAAEHDERRRNNGVGDDFYRFQNREKRKEAEGRLRMRFEEDRRRVGEMRGRGGVRVER
ncbi:hypothetical protein P153DRAFT_342940 [Dothidotthia symphoricarpi CBS 119687]|uniref:RRM domain-containing protein n=1 Tax=Dothidotthia symphoricarpi CBS 119687 TaxID=1392245 RepID=A0A6A6AA29_9PLEO|nr:uncharacterized protein P153DRAFT_342940 [Dothidotthia symphoricarpi CBS 119687]KAF2127944.1 hypothetical protein P153DRAFT_342940 [Dothidotthia symphoricarpi CBS 119687]